MAPPHWPRRALSLSPALARALSLSPALPRSLSLSARERALSFSSSTEHARLRLTGTGDSAHQDQTALRAAEAGVGALPALLQSDQGEGAPARAGAPQFFPPHSRLSVRLMSSPRHPRRRARLHSTCARRCAEPKLFPRSSLSPALLTPPVCLSAALSVSRRRC